MTNEERAPLPDRRECSRAVRAGNATALQRFILWHQPSNGEAAKSFRHDLAQLLGRPFTAAATLSAAPPVTLEPVVLLEWIRLNRYCELSGDTPNAVHARRSRRQWIDGVQSKVGPDGNLWVNPAAVNDWVSGIDDSSNAHPALRSCKK